VGPVGQVRTTPWLFHYLTGFICLVADLRFPPYLPYLPFHPPWPPRPTCLSCPKIIQCVV